MSHHRWLRLLLIVLVVAALPLTVALAQEGGAADSPASLPQFDPEVEPNNSFAEANTIWGPTEAKIAPARDKDYFAFIGYTELDLVVTITLPAGGKLKPLVIVYDQWENELARAMCPTGGVCVTTRMTEEAVYYIRVTDSKNKGGNAYGYTLTAEYHDPNEPNDSMATATPLVFSERTYAFTSAGLDFDYYSFPAEAGDEFHLQAPGVGFDLLGPNGENLGFLPGDLTPIFKVETTGTHYLRGYTDYGDRAYWVQLWQLDRPVVISFDSAGTLGGVAFEPGDLLRYSPLADTWEMAFDASDMGLVGNLTAVKGPHYWLLAFDTPQTIPGLGDIRPQDVIRFEGTTVDGETSGMLSWHLDGSDVGLTTAGEAIDALGSDPGGRLTASFKNTAKLPGATRLLKVQKDDIAGFVQGELGETTTGHWLLSFDGRTLGGHGANLIGMDYHTSWRPEGYFLLFDRPVTIGGVAYGQNDIIHCWLSAEGDTCESLEKAFDGALVGGYRIDAIDYPPFVIVE